MRNSIWKFPYVILVLVLFSIATFAFISSRLSKKANLIDAKAASSTQVLVEIMNVQRGIQDIEINAIQNILLPNLGSAAFINLQSTVIRKEIEKLRKSDIIGESDLSLLDSLNFYTEKQIDFFTGLLSVSRDKGINEAILYKKSSLTKDYQSKISSIVQKVEANENAKLQTYLREKEMNVTKLNVILYTVFIILILLGIGNLIQLYIANNKKKKELVNAEYLEKILSSISDSVITTDAQFKVKSWNKAAERLYGFKSDKVKESDIADAVRSLMKEDEISQIRDDMNKNGFWKGEVSHLNSEGKEITVQSYRAAIRDENDKIIGYVSSNRDITEKKLADQLLSGFNQELADQVKAKTKEILKNEKKLVASEKKLRQVLTSSADIFYVIDKEYKIVLINEIAEKLLSESWGKSVILGANILELIPQDTEESIHENFKKTFKGERVEYEVHLEKNNLPGWVYVSYSPVVDENGEITGAYVVTKDITERKKVEAKLSETNEKYRSLVEQSLTGIYITQNEKFIYVNPQFAEIFGYTQEEMLGHITIKDVVYEPDWEMVKNISSNRLKGFMEKSNYHFRGIKKDGAVIHAEVFGSLAIQSGVPVIIGTLLDVTVQYKAEEEVRKANDRFELMNLANSNAVWDWNLITNEVWGNEVHQNYYGLLKTDPGPGDDEWIKRQRPDDRERIRRLNDEFFASTKKDIQYEYEFFTENKGWITILANTYLERDIEGKPKRLIGTMMDITEAKKAEKAIRQSEEKYRSLIAQASEPIIVYSMDGIIHEFNNTACEMSGYSREEFAGLRLNDLLQGDIVIDKTNHDSLLAGNILTINRQLKKKDGELLEMEIVARVIEDDKILAFGRDITERKRIEGLIRKEKELSESIISNLPDIFYLFDKEGNFLRWNDNLEKVTGYTEKEIAGITPFSLFKNSTREPLLEKLKEIEETGKIEFEGNFLTKTGEEIPYFFKGWEVNYEGNLCIIGIGVDITNRKKAEVLLKRSYDDIRRLASHLEEVREEERINIAREIHDELGQQLTVLKMDITWLGSKLINKEEAVQKKMDDLVEMIDNTVKTVRRISSELRPSILDDLGLLTAMEWHAQEFEKRSGVKTKFKTEIEELKLPVNKSTSIYRIFQETLTNIARHAKASNVSAMIKVKDDQLVLTIKDDGKGFDSFAVGNKKTLGILGMRERASIMGGEYQIESNDGKGTVTKVRIPVSN